MDASHFDALTRALASGTTRRRLVQAITALGLGGLFAGWSARPTAAQSL